MFYLVLQILFLDFFTMIEAGRRIFDGRDAAIGELPYVAGWGGIKRVGKGKMFEPCCTASILSPTWTLSAAHCMDKPPAVLTLTVVYYASYAPQQKGKFSKVLEVIAHPNYFDSPFLTHDICLVRTNPIQISQYGVLSAIDYKSFIGQEVFVAGHGATNYSSKVDLTFTVRKPLQVFKGMVIRCLEDNAFENICVSSPCGSLAMICGGDSGGPVIHSSGIVGVNSWGGTQCESLKDLQYFDKHTLAQSSSAGTTPISPHVNWISRTMASVQRKK